MGKLELLTNIDMLLMVEREIGAKICHVIHRYAKANNKYIEKYNKDIECNSVESSYLMYLNANNLYGQAFSQNIEKCNKLTCRIHVVHIRALKQALIHGLILNKYTEYFNLIKNHG